MTSYVDQCTRCALSFGLLVTGAAFVQPLGADQQTSLLQPVGYSLNDGCPPCYPCDPCPPCPPARVAPQPSVTPDIDVDDPASPSAADPSMAPGADTPALGSGDFSPSPAPSTFASTGDSGSLGVSMTGDSSFQLQFFAPSSLHSALVPVGSNGVSVYKASVNGNVLPTDRVFFMTEHYHNYQTNDPTSFDVTAFTFGLEQTFGRCRRNSIELRVPFGSTAEDVTAAAPAEYDTAVQMGDISIAFKRLLYRDCGGALTAGFGITLPTSDDLSFGGISVDNKSVHLQPHLGLICTPNSYMFTQAFIGIDFDAGTKTYTTTSSFDVNDQAFFYASFSQGVWLCGDTCCGYRTSGVAAQVELHYTSTIEDGDSITLPGGSGATVTTVGQDHLIAVPALIAQIGAFTDARLAGGFPLLSDSIRNRAFDTEVKFILNRRF